MAKRVTVRSAYSEPRVQRRPAHSWNVTHRPWQLQPICIAPVLAGETLKGGSWQSLAVTDPVKSPLIGWNLEYFWFYVKLTDLDARDTITDMIINPSSEPGTGLASLEEAANLKWYNYAGSVPWAKLALKRVVEEYFRNEGEDWDDYVLDGVPLASIAQESVLNSFVPTDQLSDVDVDVDLDADGTVTAGEVDIALRQWQMLQQAGIVNMTYDDYLRTFGVRASREAAHRPELLRHVKQWKYPSNAVEPTTGGVSSAVFWNMSETIDKDRFFKEPGFIIGVTCARPKVYLKAMAGAGVGMLDHLLAWLPAQMHGDKMSSLVSYAEGAGPVSVFGDASDAGYTVDIRDLFVYGDQFTNKDVTTATDMNLVTLPNANGTHRFADGTDADALFVGATAATRTIRQDGVVRLQIAGRQRDNTPGAPVPIAV